MKKMIVLLLLSGSVFSANSQSSKPVGTADVKQQQVQLQQAHKTALRTGQKANTGTAKPVTAISLTQAKTGGASTVTRSQALQTGKPLSTSQLANVSSAKKQPGEVQQQAAKLQAIRAERKQTGTALQVGAKVSDVK